MCDSESVKSTTGKLNIERNARTFSMLTLSQLFQFGPEMLLDERYAQAYNVIFVCTLFATVRDSTSRTECISRFTSANVAGNTTLDSYRDGLIFPILLGGQIFLY